MANLDGFYSTLEEFAMLRQLLFEGFPEGSQKIGDTLRILKKQGMVTYFVGDDNYFSHPEGDVQTQRFAFATLMMNGHVRPCDLENPPLSIPHRTLMNWVGQLRKKGSSSFFQPRPKQNPRVMTAEKIDECCRLLGDELSIGEVAKRVGINVSTLQKAVQRGAVKKNARILRQ